jgi:hypothetical protein
MHGDCVDILEVLLLYGILCAASLPSEEATYNLSTLHSVLI